MTFEGNDGYHVRAVLQLFRVRFNAPYIGNVDRSSSGALVVTQQSHVITH